MPFETWGTFSVADHLSPRAFVADVLLYDRLVIPVPDDKERERWTQLGRLPEVLDRKLLILEQPSRRRPEDSLVTRVPWTEDFRADLDRRYEDERRAAREGIADLSEGEAMDRGIVADWMKSGDPSTPEIVPAYTSYAAMNTDWKPVSTAGDHVARPDDRLAGVIGWEFFVPEDSALDDDGALAEAVELAQRKEFREARAEFHAFRRDATRQGASPKQFRREFETLLARYQEQTAKTKHRTRTLNAFVLVGASTSLVGAIAVPPLGIAAAALGLATIGVEKGWRSPRGTQQARALAMFHDAQKHFDWKPS
jgi:hypothetical protein